MKDEGILPGDLVVVRKQGMAKSGQTIIALLNGEAHDQDLFQEEYTHRTSPSQ